MLEEVVHLGAYPKCVLAFQIFIVKRDASAQLFAACANGLLSALNQAGIHMKIAPVAALSLGVKLNDMVDDDALNIEIDENPVSLQHTIVDLVVLTQSKEILYMMTSGKPFDFLSTVLGNEKALEMFEAILERKTNETLAVMTRQQL